jgi:hypothetical protein
MATTKKPPTKKASAAKRNEVVIRVTDIPTKMFEKIKTNAKNEGRSQGKEILQFLKENKY